MKGCNTKSHNMQIAYLIADCDLLWMEQLALHLRLTLNVSLKINMTLELSQSTMTAGESQDK